MSLNKKISPKSYYCGINSNDAFDVNDRDSKNLFKNKNLMAKRKLFCHTVENLRYF